MFSAWWITAGFALTGCRTWDGSTWWNTGETGREDSLLAAPVHLELVSVSCSADHRIRFYAETAGWTSDGSVFAQRTAAEGPQWSEEHELVSFEFARNGSWDHLERILDDGSQLAEPEADWQPNRSSAFTCPEARDDAFMSYAFAVRDTDRVLADCIAFGHDPEGLLQNRHERVNDPTFDPTICSVGVPAR